MDDVRDSLGEQWRREILDGIKTLPNLGAVPGTLIVFGENARPILRNAQKKSVWVAAGNLGKGRVFVIGHSQYISKLKGKNGYKHPVLEKFHDNIKQWLTKSKDVDTNEIKMLSCLSVDKLNSTKIIVAGAEKNKDISDKRIMEFVASGGALLHALCPWGWLQVNPQHSLKDIPLYSVLEEAGILYTKGYFRCPENGIQVESGLASESYHLKFAMQKPHLENTCRTLSQIYDVPLEVLKDLVCSSEQYLQNIIDDSGDDWMPSANNPISTVSGRSTIYIRDLLAMTDNSPMAMPGVNHFPGDFNIDPPEKDAELFIESSICACHPTDLYVRAGKEISINALDHNSVNKDWEIQIGCHTDRLNSSKSLKRWPVITDRYKVSKKEIKVMSRFGGLLYIRSPPGKASINLHVSGVMKAPLFDVTRPETVSQWQGNRHAPGLWANLCGQHIIITLPSASIRDIEDPSPALETWDLIVRANHHLRGTDPNETQREWIVADVQPFGDHMHSGNPLVTPLDLAQPDNVAFLLNSEFLMAKGNWSLFHELGHNMQRTVWTFTGTAEVTCNIFTLHAMDVIAKRDVWLHPWLKSKIDKAKNYIKSCWEYTKWQADPGIGLFVYAQIINQFGWSVFKKTFRHYENIDLTTQLKTDWEKVDFWFQTMSKFAEYNLAPLADLWNVPLSEECRKQMSDFQAFLPEDEITEAVPEKVQSLEEEYPNLLRSIVKPVDVFEQMKCCPRKWTVTTKVLP